LPGGNGSTLTVTRTKEGFNIKLPPQAPDSAATVILIRSS
jgi:hypothetical protein